MTDEPAHVLDGEITVWRIVTGEDVLVTVESGGLPVLDAVGMLTMAIDSLLHPELGDDAEPYNMWDDEP